MRTYSDPVPLSRQEVFALEAEQDERRGSASPVGLRGEAEVGEGTLAVVVDDEPGHLAIVDLEDFSFL